jgi:hypothetical protein
MLQHPVSLHIMTLTLCTCLMPTHVFNKCRPCCHTCNPLCWQLSTYRLLLSGHVLSEMLMPGVRMNTRGLSGCSSAVALWLQKNMLTASVPGETVPGTIQCQVLVAWLLLQVQKSDRKRTHPDLGLLNSNPCSGDIDTLTGPGEKPGQACWCSIRGCVKDQADDAQSNCNDQLN